VFLLRKHGVFLCFRNFSRVFVGFLSISQCVTYRFSLVFSLTSFLFTIFQTGFTLS
jgi:hypothetical protein